MNNRISYEQPHTVLQGLKISRALTLLVIFTTGCSIPVGRFSQPMTSLRPGETLLGVGAGTVLETSGRRASRRLPPPRAAVSATVGGDFGLPGGNSIGLAVSRLPLGDDARYWVTSIKGERRSTRWPWLSGFLETTLAVLDAPAPPPGQAPSEIPPWIDAFPLFGSRIYLPIAQGGLVLTQGLGLSIVSVSAPGSVAADLHFGSTYVLPELRWDPTYHGIDGARTFVTITGILYVGQRF